MKEMAQVAVILVYMATAVEIAWRTGWLHRWATIHMAPHLDDASYKRHIRRIVIGHQLFQIGSLVAPAFAIAIIVADTARGFIFAFCSIMVLVIIIRNYFAWRPTPT